jgi:signal transduction histidine kinase
MRNLVRNAIQYTPCCGGHTTRASEARIEVHDSDIGIAAVELARIFNPFHRAKTSRADGLGLGLFIANRGALSLGHRIEVRSALGHGSCFAVVANCASKIAARIDATANSYRYCP